MKRICFIFVIAALMAVSYAPAYAEVKWLSLQEGMEKAKSEKKPMIVDFFYGMECPRCEALQKGVYDEPSISKKIMDDFVPVRINLKKELTREEEELGNKFDYKKDCLLLFLDSSGNVIKDPLGKRLCFIDTVEPKQFIEYLDMIKARLK
jgi:thioredoxin-related protein